MEKRLTIKNLADACNTCAVNCDENIIVSDIVTDSRKIEAGSVFVALRGENFDGHNFAAQAVKSGAVCCVVDENFENAEGLPVIKTENTLKALGVLASYYRKNFAIPSIAITGSVGKTSTKDMLSCVLGKFYKTLKTEGNFNNEIGLPLTAFRLSDDDEIAVFEMGMSAAGEISRLSKIAAPETAVLTNIGYSHIENLKSQENILKAKLEILDGLAQDGTVVINGDDKFLWEASKNLPVEVLTYGIENDLCDITAKNIKKFSSRTEFDFFVDGEEHHAIINVPGVHHIYNALAAILVGLKYNMSVKKIIEGISDFEPSGMRQKIESLENCVLIRDCYNASPTSIKSGLEVLSVTVPKDKDNEFRRVAILGDMLELGEYSEQAHEEIGALVCEYDLSCLIAIGSKAQFVAKGAIENGFSSSEIYVFYDNSAAITHINDILRKNDIVLLKGSRGMRLEEIADYIVENEKNIN